MRISRLHISRDRAFTLIELLVVILIIGILVAVALPSFLGQTTKAQNSAAQQNLYNVYISGKASAWSPTNNSYPTIGDPKINPGKPGDAASTGTLFGLLDGAEPEFDFQNSVSSTNVNQIEVNEITPQTVYYADQSASGTIFCSEDVEAPLPGVSAGLYSSSGTECPQHLPVTEDAPTVTFTSGPNDPSPYTTTSGVFTWTTSGEVVTTSCALDGGAYEPCTSGYSTAFTSDPVDGTSHTLNVQVTNLGGSATSTYGWTVQPEPLAVLTFTSGPANPSPYTITSGVFTWTTAGEVTSTSCALDGGAYGPCSSGYSTAFTSDPVGGTNHSLSVKLTNPGGSNSAAYGWTVQAQPAPSISITSGPANPSPYTTNSGTFDWTTTGEVTSTMCSLDGGSYTACSSGYDPSFSSDLGSGTEHTLNVRVSNPGGSSSAAYSWTVQAQPAPSIDITSGPADPSPYTTTGGAFTWTTSGEVASTMCSLDGSSYTACSSGYSTSFTSDLGSGTEHTLNVRVSNPGGLNVGSYSWTVQPEPAPTVSFTAGPANPSPSTTTTGTFNWTTAGPVDTISCSLDGDSYTTCSSGYSPSFSSDSVNGTDHTLSVEVSNAAGTGSATYNWRVQPAPVWVPEVDQWVSSGYSQPYLVSQGYNEWIDTSYWVLDDTKVGNWNCYFTGHKSTYSTGESFTPDGSFAFNSGLHDYATGLDVSWGSIPWGQGTLTDPSGHCYMISGTGYNGYPYGDVNYSAAHPWWLYGQGAPYQYEVVQGYWQWVDTSYWSSYWVDTSHWVEVSAGYWSYPA